MAETRAVARHATIAWSRFAFAYDCFQHLTTAFAGGQFENKPASSSQPQPKLPAQMPLDTAVAAHDPGDVPTDALVEHRLPRHQAEPEPVFDHGEASAGEVGRAR